LFWYWYYYFAIAISLRFIVTLFAYADIDISLFSLIILLSCRHFCHCHWLRHYILIFITPLLIIDYFHYYFIAIIISLAFAMPLLPFSLSIIILLRFRHYYWLLFHYAITPLSRHIDIFAILPQLILLPFRHYAISLFLRFHYDYDYWYFAIIAFISIFHCWHIFDYFRHF
jgi:hypothetical protein